MVSFSGGGLILQDRAVDLATTQSKMVSFSGGGSVQHQSTMISFRGGSNPVVMEQFSFQVDRVAEEAEQSGVTIFEFTRDDGAADDAVHLGSVDDDGASTVILDTDRSDDGALMFSTA